MLIPSLETSLVSFSVLGQTMMVVDTIEMAVELFERRSGLYSSRYSHDYRIIVMALIQCQVRFSYVRSDEDTRYVLFCCTI
jgi:hypothetical protein